MKTILLIFFILFISFSFAQETATEPEPETATTAPQAKEKKQHDFSKSKTLTLQANLGASYLPNGNSGVIAYGFTGMFEKSFGAFTIFSGLSYTEITDRENFRTFVTTDSIRQEHVKYRSITIPVGVAFKYGQQKHRLYPLVSLAIGPQFNIKNVFTSVKTVSFMLEARAGMGVNLIKFISVETGMVYHGSLTSVRKGDIKRPMLFAAFFGLNINL
ncbi:MAG: hypothetical protein JWN78_889 [Bacteroidota bacterium]|nr:hypothetical protein [Bacteroidota bacterium]